MWHFHVLGGGISGYTNDTKRAGDSLKPCLQEAVNNIPTGEQRSAPIYLGATAGISLLRESDKAVSDAIMSSVRDVIKSFPFNFTFPEKQALEA